MPLRNLVPHTVIESFFFFNVMNCFMLLVLTSRHYTQAQLLRVKLKVWCLTQVYCIGPFDIRFFSAYIIHLTRKKHHPLNIVYQKSNLVSILWVLVLFHKWFHLTLIKLEAVIFDRWLRSLDLHCTFAICHVEAKRSDVLLFSLNASKTMASIV